MDINCEVCEKPLRVKWSDTHGVGACWTCGLPYRVYHYENDQRVDKRPTVAVKEAWLPLAKQYWAETQSRVFPGAFDFMQGRGGRTYSGASESEITKFNEWLDARKAEWPKQPSDEAQEETATTA